MSRYFILVFVVILVLIASYTFYVWNKPEVLDSHRNTIASSVPITPSSVSDNKDISAESTLDHDKPDRDDHTPELGVQRPSFEFDPLAKNKKLNVVLDELVNKAENGSIPAIRSLATGLQRCNSTHDTREGLDSAISGLRETGKVRLGTPGSPARTIPPGQEDFFLTFLSDNFDYCEGIDRTTRETYFDWALKGAELGDDFTLGIVSTEMPEGRDKFDFLQNIWNQYKNDGIASQLSEYHLNGVPTVNGELGSPDYKSAYSYLLVSESYLKRNLEATNSHSGLQNIANTELQNSKDRITIYLSPQETLEAEETAIRMIGEVEEKRKGKK